MGKVAKRPAAAPSDGLAKVAKRPASAAEGPSRKKPASGQPTQERTLVHERIGPALLASEGASGTASSSSSGKASTTTLENLRTPCYIAYEEVVRQNASRMLERAASLGCQLRPHMKTHKTIEGGIIATGGTKKCIAVSTLAEAEFFADAGFDDILYAVPITAAKLSTAAALARRLDAFHITLDCEGALAEVMRAPKPAKDRPWSIVIMVDCGYGRDGVDPKDLTSVELAQSISSSEKATLAGLYTHGGHSYDQSGGLEKVVELVRSVAAQEANAVAGFAATLRSHGIDVPMIGVGSTPTCSNPPLLGLDGVTEMHPGNYIYYDVMQEKLGSCKEEDIAVRVVTRIIGHYPKKNLLLVDMGWTACSKQGEDCGFGRIEGHPELKVFNLKQEAGLITHAAGEGLDFAQYPLGTLLRLEPYHSCAHTKQHDRIHILGQDRSTVTDTWRICRGW